MNSKTLSPLLIIAMQEEAQGRFNSWNPIYTGIGKVNAVYRFMDGLNRYKAQHGANPPIVINMGSAGSTHFNSGLVVNCTKFIQRDFDTSALGTPLYATPFDDIPAIMEYGERVDHLPEGICGTGDSFVAESQASVPWNIVDMEAYALAKICMYEQIPFLCLKYVTDGADGAAAASWREGLPRTAEALYEASESVLKAA